MGTMNLAVVCALVVLAASCLADGATCNETTPSGDKGLGGLYSMTRGFIDMVVKKSFITALTEEAGKNTGSA